jgi:flagellar hook-basal body complex protein FliE
MPVEPVSAALGAAAQIAKIGDLGTEAQVAPAAEPTSGFGSMLASQIQQVDGVQRAADQQQALMASGQATDVNEVVIATERAQLAMQMATQMRNGMVSAYQELFRTQI